MKKLAIALFAISFLIFGFVIFAISGDNPQPKEVERHEDVEFNETKYNELIDELKRQNSGIENVKRDGRLFDVTVKDSWYDLKDYEQKRVADGIHNALQEISYKSGLIEMTNKIDVLIIDKYGEVVY